MPSQKSSSAVAPKRERGRARVESLLEAASIVFAERGYDQATMTEIAARSSTAIGSLYRFFPTKEALGETLLGRFTERSAAALDALAARADELGADALAEALIQHVAGSRSDGLRAGAAAILEARGDAPELRRAFRARRRKQVAGILRKANPALSQERAQDRAAVIVHILKSEPALAQEEPSAARRLIPELRRLVGHYIADALRERD
jgi:AcrR family transcriptional regulator